MGMCDTCCCCCCLSRETAVKVSTYLVILYLLAEEVFDIVTGNRSIFSIIVTCGLVVSLIFLLIGIENRNKSYMKQFDTVFGIIYLFSFIGLIFQVAAIIILFVAVLTSSDNKALIDNYRKENFTDFGTLNDEEIKHSIIINGVLSLVKVILYFSLITYYYFFTRKFVIDTIKEIDSENNNRQLENGNKA